MDFLTQIQSIPEEELESFVKTRIAELEAISREKSPQVDTIGYLVENQQKQHEYSREGAYYKVKLGMRVYYKYFIRKDTKMTYGIMYGKNGMAGNDGNYYYVKVGKRTYKFYIVKGTDSQLIEPTYSGLDLESKIEITSEDSTIPLDTALTVKNVDDTSIKDKIETENYYSYDISLYSDAKGSKIEKLNNGKFLVKIPVPTELNGKELIVYYLTSNEDLEEHAVTIKDGYAEFETDHFSVYTLAEKTTSATTPTPTSNTTTDTTNTTSNPQTGDNVLFYISMLGLSIIGLAGAGIYTRKRFN